MDSHFEWEVRRKIEDKPRLTPLFSSTHDIPERIYEYNPRLFVCHNIITDKFELHSLDQEFNSFCAELPYKRLDARTMRWIWQYDIRVHGINLMRHFDDQEEKMKKAKDKNFRNWVEDVGKETRSMFAKDAWSMGT